MKKIFPILVASVAMVLASCANVDEADRYKTVEAKDANRAVLVEEFTGQKCINCPEAHDLLANITKQYDEDKIIAVCIHASALAVAPKPNVIGLKTEIGEEYFKHWKGNVVPSAVINRTGGLKPKDAWAGVINREMQRSTPLKLNVKNAYDANTRKVTINVNALSIEDLNGKLQLWIVEDGIKAIQLLPNNGRNREYEHNHVFRAAVNGAWGTDISLKANDANKSTFTYTIDPQWEANNLSVVAFIYDEANGVQQVTRQKVNN